MESSAQIRGAAVDGRRQRRMMLEKLAGSVLAIQDHRQMASRSNQVKHRSEVCVDCNPQHDLCKVGFLELPVATDASIPVWVERQHRSASTQRLKAALATGALYRFADLLLAISELFSVPCHERVHVFEEDTQTVAFNGGALFFNLRYFVEEPSSQPFPWCLPLIKVSCFRGHRQLGRQMAEALGVVWRGNSTAREHRSELLTREEAEALGVVWRGNATSISSHENLPEPDGYPSDFTWCNKDGVNYCTISLNQHIPQYCGSCWAHGAVSALGDRIKIARKAQGADVQLSVQHMLNCGRVGSCHGGTVDGPYQWIHKLSQSGSGISYFTSQPYLACSSESSAGICKNLDLKCTPENVARTCSTFGQPCVGLDSYPNATISDYGSIRGKAAMMKEIYNRGPISCGIDANPLLKYTTGIIKGFGLMDDHVVSVVGWGTDPEEGLYWIVRNSWGEYWGEQGYVRVKSGSLALERQCSWAVPQDYTAPEKENEVHCFEGGENCKAKKSADGGPRPRELWGRAEVEKRGFAWRKNSSEPSSHQSLAVPNGGFPGAFSWCDKDGKSYCTVSVNQHIPQYCGSCWAQGSMSALADRIKIARKAEGIDIQVSVQHLMNCGTAGTCNGGEPNLAYQWLKNISDKTGSGIAYTTGQPYLACSHDLKSGFCKDADFTCTAENVQRTCATFGKQCVGLSHYPNATIAEYGSIQGKDAMMKEIFNRGPIACNVDATKILNYTTGIVTAKSTETDHTISVVGWGTDSSLGMYWIVRNSWGEYWGEQGYFRAQSGSLALEQDGCTWATPKDFTAPERHNQTAPTARQRWKSCSYEHSAFEGDLREQHASCWEEAVSFWAVSFAHELAHFESPLHDRQHGRAMEMSQRAVLPGLPKVLARPWGAALGTQNAEHRQWRLRMVAGELRGDSVFMLDCLFRVFGHQTLEANLAELQERFPSLAEEAKQMAVAEELRWAACPAKEAPPSKRRWDLANMLMAHTRQVWVLRDLLHHALRRRGKPLKRDRPTSPVERQDRLEDFFATLKQSPRKVYPEGHQPLIMDKFWESLEESSMATTAPSCWKDRASRSRCSATASTWDSHWSQHMPEEQLEDISMNTSLPRKKSTGGIVLPPVVQTPPSGGSVAVTAATQKFNYLGLFPDLANRKPQPTRRLHFTEVEGGSKSDWTIDEVLVHLKTPEKEESVAAPSELSEARRLLQLDEKPSRRNSMRSMSISMSDSQLVSTLKTTSKPAPPVKKAAFGKPQGIAQHLMSLGEEELQARLLTRENQTVAIRPRNAFLTAGSGATLRCQCCRLCPLGQGCGLRRTACRPSSTRGALGSRSASTQSGGRCRPLATSGPASRIGCCRSCCHSSRGTPSAWTPMAGSSRITMSWPSPGCSTPSSRLRSST
ncbi:unnamed protein product [Effrenium voratum]|nr:unnamed protein product [Effrenium voratum]